MLAELAPPVVNAAGAAAALPDPTAPGRTIRGVLFDVDGTLYTQPRLRTAMAIELAWFAVTHPFEAVPVIRALRAYRRAQEAARRDDRPIGVDTQVAAAASATGISARQVEQIAAEWMFERPLKHVPGCRAEGLVGLLEFLRAAGVPLGVVSDYPADAKLRALGIREYFDVVLSAADVGAFKPSAAGLMRACASWSLAPGEVLYVGDRVDVDGAAAAAAGMPCVLITTRRLRDRPGLAGFSSFVRLHCVLDDHRR